ncbi:MAG: putative selenium-dependent hydroxylase accessory protein YqeC [Rhodospirillales bacterium]|nr:putative selenium-dependent hydroxylase accessory protein YqeC [Rhodospirillales bacterium]
MTLVKALGLEEARLVALTGAGGKSSLMFALAKAFAAGGERVLITTTTKMAKEQATGPWQTVQAADAQAVMAAADAAANVVLAFRDTDEARGKIVGYPPDDIARLAASRRFTRILVEADGSARRPLKAPADHEPVIPADADFVVMVAGAKGLGRPLSQDTVFRPELWAGRTGLALGSPVTALSLARMAVDPDGLARGAPERAKRALFVNQTDDPVRLAAALRTVEHLGVIGGRAPDRAVVGRLLPRIEILHCAHF